MSSFQRTRAEAHFAALHKPVSVKMVPVVPSPTADGFDRLRAELAAKRASAKLATQGE
jgi:hypothetical protein